MVGARILRASQEFEKGGAPDRSRARWPASRGPRDPRDSAGVRALHRRRRCLARLRTSSPRRRRERDAGCLPALCDLRGERTGSRPGDGSRTRPSDSPAAPAGRCDRGLHGSGAVDLSAPRSTLRALPVGVGVRRAPERTPATVSAASAQGAAGCGPHGGDRRKARRARSSRAAPRIFSERAMGIPLRRSDHRGIRAPAARVGHETAWPSSLQGDTSRPREAHGRQSPHSDRCLPRSFPGARPAPTREVLPSSMVPRVRSRARSGSDVDAQDREGRGIRPIPARLSYSLLSVNDPALGSDADDRSGGGHSGIPLPHSSQRRHGLSLEGTAAVLGGANHLHDDGWKVLLIERVRGRHDRRLASDTDAPSDLQPDGFPEPGCDRTRAAGKQGLERTPRLENHADQTRAAVDS
jgi:hypothetical protein